MSGEVKKKFFHRKIMKIHQNRLSDPRNSLRVYYRFTIGFGKGSHHFSWAAKNFENLEFEAKNQKSVTSVFLLPPTCYVAQFLGQSGHFYYPNNYGDFFEHKFKKKSAETL